MGLSNIRKYSPGKGSAPCLGDDVSGQLFLDRGGIGVGGNTFGQLCCQFSVAFQEGFLSQGQVSLGKASGLAITDPELMFDKAHSGSSMVAISSASMASGKCSGSPVAR